MDRTVTAMSRHSDKVTLTWWRGLLLLLITFDRRRLRIAGDLVRHGGLRALRSQMRQHLFYRWSIIVPSSQGPGARALAGPRGLTGAAHSEVSPHREDPWPPDRPLVSVVVPCFNYGAFVTEAVDSALAQTLRDIEIIVVEGGSTDGSTPEMLRALERPRTRVLFREGRHRVGDNRNFGISQARGRYICCLDADDMLCPTYLEKAAFVIEQYGYDVVSTSVRRFGALNETYDVLPTLDLSDLLEGNHVTTCAVFRRSLWEQAGGYEDVPAGATFLHEDWRFWIRLAALGARFANIIGEPLFLYRAHATGSLSNAPGLLPNAVQAGLIREAERDRITPAALDLSRRQAARGLRAEEGPTNLLRRDIHPAGAGPTLLLAMPFLLLGGAERLLSEVLRQLRASGYRLIVVTSLQSAPEHGDTTSWFEPATDEIYHLPRFLPPEAWQDFIDYAIAAKRVDALWIAGSTWFYEALPRLRARFPRLRVVDLLFNTVGHTANNRRFAAFIDLNLVESAAVQDWLLANGETPERVRLIPSGIDLARYVPAARAPTPGRFVVGCSGRLSEEKSPLDFLAIAERIGPQAGMSFVMTGAGPLEPLLRAAIRGRKLESRLRFLGVVEDVRTALAQYDALVLPSRLDGRPTVVLEALAMGIPVIASAVGGLPDLIRDGETGFLCRPGDIAAFARAIARLQQDPALHARMAVAARRFAEESLGLDRMVAGYAAAFEALIEPSCDPRY